MKCHIFFVKNPVSGRQGSRMQSSMKVREEKIHSGGYRLTLVIIEALIRPV
jgi:hypothetical protein